MEGVPRIPMLAFPVRRSADTPAFKSKLQKFISVQYGESPDSYSKEINELESLRASAIHATRDYSGCATLKKYYCQLHFLKSRFPMTEGSPIAVNFSWYDIFSDQVHSWSDIEFEISSVLFNIGALHSEVACADSRTTVDDMKNCVTHYQCAAWAFEHLRSTYHKFFTPDMSSELLGLMSNVCLAQAQECVVEKSLVDNRRSVITAKLLLQIVDFYQLSLKTVELMLKDASHYTDKMVKALKKWKKTIELKIAYYSSLTYLYRGQQAEDQKQFGERVTFYKAAHEKIESAIKLATKNFDRTDGVNETLNFVLDVITGKATAAQKDNEFIYHEKVPPVEAIAETIKGVALVKPIVLKIDDPGVSGPDIFARLVPMEAHEASSLYSEEKAKLLRLYSQKIEEKDQNLQKYLLAIQLETLQVHEGQMQLPQELVDCCAAMNGKPDAVKKLVELMGTLSGKFFDVDEALKEIKRIFETEETKEAEYVRICGKRPPSNVFIELRHELEKYDRAHTLAKSSNESLREAVDTRVKNLRILMKPLAELARHIPSPQAIDAKDMEAVNEMKRLATKVDEMQKQRIALHKELRDAVQNDDITQSLVVTQESDIDALFQREIAKHNKMTQVIDQNLLAQENITRALTEANARYSQTREDTMQLLTERNTVVHGLLDSYEAYDELLSKCSGGIEFYKKLEESVLKLLARAKGVAKVQDEEREAKMSAMHPNVPPPPTSFHSRPSLGSAHPKLKDYLANRKTSDSQALPTTPQTNYTPSAPFQEFTSANTNYQVPQPNTNSSNYPAQFQSNQNHQTPQQPASIANYPAQFSSSQTHQAASTSNYPAQFSSSQTQLPTNANYPAHFPSSQNHQTPQLPASSSTNYPAQFSSSQNQYAPQPTASSSNYPAQFQASQNNQWMKYPEVRAPGNSAPQETNQGYLPQTPHFQSYTPPTQQTNAYYAYNPAPTQTHTSQSQQLTHGQLPERETVPQSHPQQQQLSTQYYPVTPSLEPLPSNPNRPSLQSIPVPTAQTNYTPSATHQDYPPTNTNYHIPQQQPINISNFPGHFPPSQNSQAIKYPEIISQAKYAHKESNYGYHPYSSQFQSYTAPTQQSNAYYAYNNVPAETYTSYSQPPTSHQPQQESETQLRTLYYSGTPSLESLPSNASTPTLQPTVPFPPSRNIDLLTGIDLSAPPVTALLPPSNYPERTDQQTPQQLGDYREELVVETESKEEEEKVVKVDPLTDVSFLSKLSTEVEKLLHTIESFDKKSLNGPTNLDNKWREVLDVQNTESGKRSISVARCYPMKNRFPDILPFDQSRVSIPSSKDDYINASVLGKLSAGAVPFIITQLPLPATYGDFWHMVFDQGVELIVSLLGDQELDQLGHVYYPTTREQELLLPPFRVTLQSLNKRQGHVQRIFTLQQMQKKLSRVVIQLQFNDWGPGAFPSTPASLLAFLAEVHSFYDQQRKHQSPVVLHCLAGVGRSGIFVILSAAIKEITHGNTIIDLTMCAGSASAKRKGILIDREYLRYTYHVLLYFVQNLLVKRGVSPGGNLSDEKPRSRHRRLPSQDYIDDPFKSLLPSITQSLKDESMPHSVITGEEVTNTSQDLSSSRRADPGDVPKVPSLPKLIADLPPALTSLDPSTFKPKEKVEPSISAREVFESGRGSLLNRLNVEQTSEDDPLSSLDPLWTLHK